MTIAAAISFLSLGGFVTALYITALVHNARVWERWSRAASKRADDLYRAIHAHWSARGHDRCWENDRALYRAAGLTPSGPDLPPEEEFIARCREYYRQQSTGACQRVTDAPDDHTKAS
jgi:hypothetical protein